MGLPSWLDLMNGKTADQAEADILASINNSGAGFPVTDYEPGGVFDTLVQWAIAPAVSAIWSALSSIAQGGFIQMAAALAQADIASWNADPTQSWLYILAGQMYLVQPFPPAFTQGLILFNNTTGATQQATTNTVVTVAGVKFTVAAATPIPPGDTWVPVQAQQSGPVGNVASSLNGTLNVSLPGVLISTTPQAPSTTWITQYGALRESPQGVANRCVARWGRLSILQTSPADAYRSLALDASPNVKKVSTWSNFNPNIAAPGYQDRAVTVFLAGDAGPVDAGTAAVVQGSMAPYISICDVLYAVPCGAATYQPNGTCYVQQASQIPAIQAAVGLRQQALQIALQIGSTCYAWAIAACFDVPGVVNYANTNTDYVPAKNALITLDFSAITYAVAPAGP